MVVFLFHLLRYCCYLLWCYSIWRFIVSLSVSLPATNWMIVGGKGRRNRHWIPKYYGGACNGNLIFSATCYSFSRFFRLACFVPRALPARPWPPVRRQNTSAVPFCPVAIGCHLWYIAAVFHVILHCHTHSENNLYSGGSNLRYANNFPCVP